MNFDKNKLPISTLVKILFVLILAIIIYEEVFIGNFKTELQPPKYYIHETTGEDKFPSKTDDSGKIEGVIDEEPTKNPNVTINDNGTVTVNPPPVVVQPTPTPTPVVTPIVPTKTQTPPAVTPQQVTPSPKVVDPTPTPTPVPTPTPQSTINNNFRTQIRNNYGVEIKYGSEVPSGNIGNTGVTPVLLSDDNRIYSGIQIINNALALYPRGFFQEIKTGNPLIIYLVETFSQNTVTGCTVTGGGSNVYMYIGMRTEPGETFFHESFHYIEYYITQHGSNFNSWNSFNPVGFTYGTQDRNQTFAYTSSPNAYFVNTYAQSAAPEDRASTFEYMMSQTRYSCMNNGTPIWRKANEMANQIDLAMNTVSSSTIEYWERYL